MQVQDLLEGIVEVHGTVTNNTTIQSHFVVCPSPTGSIGKFLNEKIYI